MTELYLVHHGIKLHHIISSDSWNQDPDKENAKPDKDTTDDD